MEWIDYVEMAPKNRDQVIYKIENDGYTLDIELTEVYPLQTKLF